MKRASLCLAVFVVVALSDISAQDFSRKFGKITDYEMDMITYSRDTSAVAVYLYEDMRIYYTLTSSSDSGPFKQHRSYAVKIKVLKPDGVALGDVAIPYYMANGSRETISGLTVCAYNKVNGKIVKTQLKSSDVLTEQVSENLSLRKFSIPEVRVGTVIEYRYKIISDFFYNIEPIWIQHSHPVVHSFAEIATPQYFKFSINTLGEHRVSVDQSTDTKTDYYDNVRTCVAEHVRGLDKEPYIWCVDDFRTKITFELSAIEIPGVFYKNYTRSWESVNNTLNDSSFDKNLKIPNLLKDEVAVIKLSTNDEVAQLRNVLKLVISRMNWDGRYTIWSNNVRQKFREGSGSSAEVNFVLNSALRGAGFQVTPILLNPRSRGRLPYSHPSLDNINTFVLLVTLSDGSQYVVDATHRDNDVNLITTELMVDRARVYNDNSSNSGWVDLTCLSTNSQQVLVQCELDKTGKLSGTMTNHLNNATGLPLKSRYRNYASEDDYIEWLETDNHMDISSYEITGLSDPAVTESLTFSSQAATGGDYIYLRATVVPFMTQNILTQQERKLPIEFSVPAKHAVTAVITIPEGYEVEELPKAIRMNTCDNGASYLYYAAVSQNVITVRLEYILNRLLFTPVEYPDLHAFFSMMIEKNNSRIILKKI